MKMHLFDTGQQLELLRPEIEQRLLAVVASGRFILGPEVEAFEQEFAEYLGVDHAVGVASGTDALVIALRVLGVGPGSDVVVPSFTFYATAEAVINAGARPVFCDIDPETFCVTAETVARALTPATRAVIPVHLFGRPAPMLELRTLAAERGLALVEDAAQAAGARVGGARVGALGDAAAFSFYPSKNLFCLGDGGAIATDDEAIAERARLLRQHGSPDKRSYFEIGVNSRLDELQAAVLRVLLPHLDEWNARRRRLAQAYADSGLGELVSLPEEVSGGEGVHHLYVVRSERRDELLDALQAAGIEARANYRTPVHRQSPLANFAPETDLTGTELAADRNLALPMGPTLGADTAEAVTDALRASVQAHT
jgi:dTDP-4-amino-4,6-dideoxygalactose transaminase